ncbi:MAG: cell division protein SepF [Synechococcus sp. ELA619]
MIPAKAEPIPLIPTPWSQEVLVMHPNRFNGAMEAVAALRQQKTVVLNLSLMPAEEAQRAADFVSGGAFALDGQQERLGKLVFLFAPHHVDLSRS